jgi:pyruvate kinase
VVGIIIDIQESGCRMEIKIGGTLKQKCQCRFTTGKHTNLPLLSLNDIKDIGAISQVAMIDLLAVPFASGAGDIQHIKELLGESGKDIKIVAKIDSMHGIEKFKEISDVADGVIFVRNELQWELPSEKLMIAQKWAIQQCNSLAKPIFL